MLKVDIFTVTFLTCAYSVCFSDVKVPAVFGDNMIIQQNKPFIVWGCADADERVSISLLSQHKEVIAAQNGK